MFLPLVCYTYICLLYVCIYMSIYYYYTFVTLDDFVSLFLIYSIILYFKDIYFLSQELDLTYNYDDDDDNDEICLFGFINIKSLLLLLTTGFFLFVFPMFALNQPLACSIVNSVILRRHVCTFQLRTFWKIWYPITHTHTHTQSHSVHIYLWHFTIYLWM